MASSSNSGKLPLFGDESYSGLGQELSDFDPRPTIGAIAGLLTVPAFHPEVLRLEALLHLACLHCSGKRSPRPKDVRRWLHDILGQLPVRRFEDPPEDAFVHNVIGPTGNYRVFSGTWEGNASYLQDALDCLCRTEWGSSHVMLQQRLHALLTLSDKVAERSSLERWASSEPHYPTTAFLPKHLSLPQLSRRVGFSHSQLAAMELPLEWLAPFLLMPSERESLRTQHYGTSLLARFPLLLFGKDILVASPHSVGAAIRLYLLEWASTNDQLQGFSTVLRSKQRDAALERAPRQFHALPPTLRGSLPAVPDTVPATGALARFDTNKVAYLLLLHDDLEQFVKDRGLPSTPSSAGHAALVEHVSSVAAFLRDHGDESLIVLIGGGLGLGRDLAFPTTTGTGSPVIGLSLPDFTFLASGPEASLLRVWKLLQHERRVNDGGVVVVDAAGFINTYSFWEEAGFSLLPRNFEYPTAHGRIAIGPEFAQPWRVRHYRLNDVHAVPVSHEDQLAVRRLTTNSFFRDTLTAPIYASEEILRTGELAGVVEIGSYRCWVWAVRPDAAPEAVKFTYQLWDGLLTWLQRLLPLFPALQEPTPVHVRLALLDLDRWNLYSTEGGTGEPDVPRVMVTSSRSEVLVELPFQFLVLFNRPTNDGERVLLEYVTKGLLEVLSSFGSRSGAHSAEELVARCMPNRDAKTIHQFKASHFTDYFPEQSRSSLRLISPEDRVAWEIGLAWRLRQPSEAVELSDAEECIQLLNGLVAALWADLRTQLSGLNRGHLLERVLRNNEATVQDRRWWQRTVRALTGLYDEARVQSVAGSREGARGITIQSGRVLVEMASSTCPPDGPTFASDSDLDHLLAGVALTLELAADSDAIYRKIAVANVKIFASGALGADRSFFSSVANPFVLSSFAGRFQRALAAYEDLYLAHEGSGRPPDSPLLTDTEALDAFTEEFGVHPEQLFDFAGELVDLAIEARSAVVTTSGDDLRGRLTANRGLTTDEVDRLLSRFVLLPRPRWDQAPPGYRSRDWEPWHYRRRLSLVARPLVALESSTKGALLYGADQLLASMAYLWSGIEAAWLPQDHFASTSMRRYLGAVANRLGNQFTREVEAILREVGWSTRREVKVSTLGGPKVFGDLDVIAWRRGDTRLLLVECKRLQPAQGLGEIVELLEEFRGEADDRLGRHLRRCIWVQDNLAQVVGVLDIGEPRRTVYPLLVTNSEVPMQFKQDLKLPPTQVIAANQLSERLQG